MKSEKTIIAKIERYPDKCNECPFFRLSEYQCHNERGKEADCELGYMKGNDMRDFMGYRLFGGCRIRSNPNISII